MLKKTPAPWEIIFPGFSLVCIVVCFFLVLCTQYDGGNDKSSMGSLWPVNIQMDDASLRWH